MAQTTFVTLNVEGQVVVYLPSDTEKTSPDFIGSVEDAAKFMAENDVEEFMGSSTLDFATDYGWETDDARSVIGKAYQKAFKARKRKRKKKG